MRDIDTLPVFPTRSRNRCSGNEERVGAREQLTRSGGQSRSLRAHRSGGAPQARVETRLARLNVLLTVPKALLDLHAKRMRIASNDMAIGAIAPPRLQLDPQQPQRTAERQLPGQRIPQQRLSHNLQ